MQAISANDLQRARNLFFTSLAIEQGNLAVNFLCEEMLTDEFEERIANNQNLDILSAKLSNKRRFNGELSKNDLEEWGTVLSKIKVSKSNNIVFLSSSDQDVQDIIGTELQFPLKEINSSQKQEFLNAIEYLNCIFDKELINKSIRYVVGIDNIPGALNSCSTEDFPGLIAISINNDRDLLCEQIVHESTHCYFSQLLFHNQGIKSFFESLPSMVSPYTNTVRPLLRLMHGCLAYGNVSIFWSQISGHSDNKNRFQLTRKLYLEGNRIIESILDETGKDYWEQIKRSVLLHKVNSSNVVANNSNMIDFLNPIEQAELTLALNGEKVSRISVTHSNSKSLYDYVSHYGSIVFGNDSYVPCSDVNINGFSNLPSDIVPHILNTNPEAEVFAYIGSDIKAVKTAFQLDMNNEAGSLLGIPECCQHFFKEHWDYVINEFQGDFTSLYMNTKYKESKIIFGDWTSNYFSMFKGSGFTWHFPCSLKCEETQLHVIERSNRIKSINFELYSNLSALNKMPILWIETNGLYYSESEECELFVSFRDSSKLDLSQLGIKISNVENYESFKNHFNSDFKLVLWF